jgi:hypothetical protein
LKETNFTRAYLEEASFQQVQLRDDNGIGPRLADVHRGNPNLADIEWWQIDKLGDESEARELDQLRKSRIRLSGNMYSEADARWESRIALCNRYEEVARAYRQLAKILQDQGSHDSFVRFIYRAQVVEKKILRLRLVQSRDERSFSYRARIQGKERPVSLLGHYLFSILLDALAGYGYRPGRAFAWYLGSIFGFALLYWRLGGQPPLGAFILSLTSFHGRGFLPNDLSNKIDLGSPIIILATLEAVLGLFIEISFIATFTQRFFGK